MKKIIKAQVIFRFLLAGVIVCVGWQGCKKELDLTPQGSLTPSILASSYENMETLLVGVYAMLDEYHTNSGGEPNHSSPTNWQYGDVTSDDAYKGSTLSDQPLLLDMEKFVHNATNTYFNTRWKVLYEGISRANSFLKILKTATTLSNTQKITMLAEARFLRAHFYFQLYRTFKNVPYIDENSTNETMLINVDGILPKIIEDFEYAKANLPNKGALKYGRVDKLAATAYLGKVYLYRAGYKTINYTANLSADGSDFNPSADALQDFKNAKNEFDAVYGQYTLTSKFRDIYDPTIKAQNTETIFPVVFSVKDGAPSGDNGDAGSFLNTINGGPGGQDNNGGVGFYVPSENLANAYKTDNGLPRDAFILGKKVNEYNDDNATGGNMSDYGKKQTDAFTPYAGTIDPRLDFTIGRRGIPFLDYGLHPGEKWARESESQGNYSRKKRFISKAWFTLGYGDKPRLYVATAIDFHVIRYADVLLMLSECEVELGNLSRAQQLVDEIRARAQKDILKTNNGSDAANYNIALYGSGHATFADKIKARQAVRFERRLEMALEGSRFFDLVRWGIAEKVINDNYAPFEPVPYMRGKKFKSAKNEFFPIPQNQIDLSQKEGKPALIQNKGY